MCIMFIWIVLAFCWRVQGRTNTGKSYIVMVPAFTSNYNNETSFPRLLFYLYTMTEHMTEVKITTEGMVNVERYHHIFIFHNMECWIPEIYQHKAMIGLKGIFKFEGNDVFGMNVFSSNDVHSASMISLIPTDKWGTKYIVFTLKNNPSVHVVTKYGPNTITFTIPSDSNVELQANGVTYELGQANSVELKGGSSLEISNCQSPGSLTGTVIESSLSFGVIAGNCETSAGTFECGSTNDVESSSTDSVAEMLLSLEYWGREFITLTLPTRQSKGYVVVTAGEDDTKVFVAQVKSSDNVELSLEQRGQTLQINDTRDPFLLSSNKAVSVFYVQRSACTSSGNDESAELGDTSVTMLIPCQLFYYSFSWQSPSLITTMKHYMAVVIPYKQASHLALDGHDVPLKGYWTPVVGKPEWYVGHLHIKEGYHQLTIRISLYFMCYIYGLGKKLSYMSPTNYLMEPINAPCTHLAATMVPGDFWDNDCDHRTDEEYPDGLDNDNDGAVDEDIVNVNIARTATGKLYLFMFPGVTDHYSEAWPTILLFFFTFHKAGVQVRLTTEHLKSLKEVFNLKEGQLFKYSLSRDVMNEKKSGVKGTFRAESEEGQFCLSVLIAEWRSSIDTLTLIAVESWGTKYFVVTLGTTPSVHLIAHVATKIFFYFRHDQKSWFEFDYGTSIYDMGEHVRIELASFQSFEISECEGRFAKGRLTGSMVEGDNPFGVISGSCRAVSPASTCRADTEHVDDDTRDLSAEMLLPVRSYGKEFITLTFPDVKNQSYLVVVASADNTVITLAGDDTHSLQLQEYTLNYLGDYIVLNLPGMSRVLTSSKAVQVMHVLRSNCDVLGTNRIGLNGDPSIGILIPSALFYYKYTWSTYSRHIEANHKLVTVSKTQFLDSLKLDNYLLHIDGRVAIAGTDLWEVIYSKLHYEERHIMVSTKFTNFGVYVYGVTNEMSYINPVNFVITNINMPCVSTLDEMLMKDEIDNDCDGKIDEEMKDNIDNDGDDKIDEDLNDNEPETANVVTSSPISQKTTMLVTTGTTRPFQVLTMPAVTTMNATTPAEEVEEVTWHWSEWACSRKCDVSDLVRKRMCLSNEPTSDAVECPGSVSELTPGTCYLNVKCPADCPIFQWDVNCKMSCANCMTDCDKFNGTCTRCQAGYKTPEEACYKECDENEFGENCEGNCVAKCGADCVNRVTGECSGGCSKQISIPVVLLIIVSCVPHTFV